MTPEQADRVFLAFRQAEESTTRTFGGTGLGLTISRRLAQSLGGDLVIVHTARGEGSRFRITVAIDTTDCTWLEHPATAVAVPADPEQTADGALETELSGHILLAEDGVDNQRLITHFLSRAGLEVTVVENGKLALETALESVKDGRPFDIIVTDINMPVMDGYRATQLLRERGWRRPIIALTANAMSDDEDRSLRAGCDAHLTKPIDRALLLRTVGRFLTSNELQS